MLTNEDVLKLLISKRIPPLLRKEDVNKDVVIGYIGERGACKSVSAGAVGIHDYMMMGEACWSNMELNYEVKVSRDLASRYGLQLGTVHYQSEALNMRDLLHGKPKFHNGVVIIDEINIAVADARRAMANQNLAADDIIQQLRKMDTAMIYTCIHEMFVDLRIRDNTDIFIQCKDSKFNPENWHTGQKQGSIAEWNIHALSDKGLYILQSERLYNDFVGQWLFAAREYWGVIPTDLKQKRRKYSIDIENDDGLERFDIGMVRDDKNDWLSEKALEIYRMEQNEFKPAEFYQVMGRALTRAERETLAAAFGIAYDRKNVYKVNQEIKERKLIDTDASVLVS